MYKEKILQLVERIAKTSGPERDEDLDNVASAMESFGHYVQRRYAMEYQIPIIRFRYDEEEVRWRVKDLDERRRIAHESAMANVSFLNNICKLYDAPAIFNGDKDDRYQVADFCEKTVIEFFGNEDRIKVIDATELENMSKDLGSFKDLEASILDGTIDQLPITPEGGHDAP